MSKHSKQFSFSAALERTNGVKKSFFKGPQLELGDELFNLSKEKGLGSNPTFETVFETKLVL